MLGHRPDGEPWSTLLLLNCLFLFFIHSKLELLKQFPASNDGKNYIYEKIGISEIELLDQQSKHQWTVL